MLDGVYYTREVVYSSSGNRRVVTAHDAAVAQRGKVISTETEHMLQNMGHECITAGDLRPMLQAAAARPAKHRQRAKIHGELLIEARPAAFQVTSCATGGQRKEPDVIFCIAIGLVFAVAVLAADVCRSQSRNWWTLTSLRSITMASV